MHFEYLTGEYEAKLRELVAEHADLTWTVAEERYRTECDELRETLRDDTPDRKVRRIAFHQLEWNVSGPDRGSDDETTDDMVG